MGLAACLALAIAPGCTCSATPTRRPRAELPQERESPAPSIASTPEISVEPDSPEHPPSPPPESGSKPESKNAEPPHGSGADGAENPAAVPAPNVRAANRQAREHSAAAKTSAAGGDHAKAFREARRGWELVAPLTDDAESQQLAESLETQMRESARRANAGQGSSSKVLVVE